MQPLISIIIPCYNQAAFLPKAITSLQHQTFTNWECIIIDDGSTDDCVEIMIHQTLEDKRFRLIRKPNGGSASARNLGLKAAIGEYIQFMDADDYIDSRKIEKQLALMQAQSTDMSYTAFRHQYHDGSVSEEIFVKLNATTILTRWGLGYSIPPHAFMYRTTYIKNNHITFDEHCRYREDWNWLITCFSAHPKINFLSDYCGAYYFHNKASKTSSYIKIQSGNFTFLAYMTSKLHGMAKLLWIYRISEEVWMWLLRIIKYQSAETISLIRLMCMNTISTICLIAALLFMPFSLFSVLKYCINTYIIR